MIPSTDEFGGYSSRLRLSELSDFSQLATQESNSYLSKNDDTNFEKSLCDLLGIDIEAKALEIIEKDRGNKSLYEMKNSDLD